MKKLLSVSLLTLIGLLALNTEIYSQRNPERAEKKEQRAEQQDAIDAKLTASINAKNFVFFATQIFSTQDVNIQNIQLSSLWGVWVTPQQFKAYLPIYGTETATGLPSLASTMDFFTSNYTFSVQPMKNGGNRVNITAIDTWTLNTYTYSFTVTANGTFSMLNVNSNFRPPVTFRGNVESL